MLRLFFLLIACLFSCKKTDKTAVEKENFINTNPNYNFANPTTFELTYSLREISGLSYDNGLIFTHNDEEGIIFKINPTSGKVIDEIRIAPNADYEGIEVVDDNAILVESNGNLSFYNLDSQQLFTKKSILKTKNNVEGLCLLNSNELLIACKGQTLEDNSKNKSKAIYSYSIKDSKLNKTPFLKVSDKQIKNYLRKKINDNEFSKKKKNNFIDRALKFSPSGIAIHPKSKDIYITSAKESILIIFNSHKKLKDIIFLNKKQLPQPEGICFDEYANLFISTEVAHGKGKIHKYTTLNNQY